MALFRQSRSTLQPPRTIWRGAIVACALGLVGWTASAQAFRIELKDVAPDRIERQRAEAIGQIPFPGTPNIAQFDGRLKEKGLAPGAAMFIRVFKAESELEVWMQKDGQFIHFATYPICHWSGTLGPKTSEGDKQAPEGVYTVGWKQLHMVGRHPRSLNLGFPNVLDRQFQRTGSYILIHGGCGSVGCFAMTNPVIEEIFSLAQAALKGGQEAIHVHAFPFRLTESKLRAYALHDWYDFWRNLKDIHDQFERTRRVPRVTVCEGRYWLEPEEGEVASQAPLAVCGAPQGASPNNLMVNAPSPIELNSFPNARPVQLARPNAMVAPVSPVQPGRWPPVSPGTTANRALPVSNLSGSPTRATAATELPVACDRGLASCRKWIATRVTMMREARSRLAASTTARRVRTP